MSDRIVQSHETHEKSTQPCQFAWMAHWMGTSCTSANEAHNQLSPHYASRKDVSHNTRHYQSLSEPEREMDSSKAVKGFREATKTKMINSTEECLMTSSKKLRHEMFQGPSFPMFKPSRDSKSVLALNNGESSSHHEGVLRLQIGPSSGYDISLGRIENQLPSMPAWAPSETETPTRESQCQPEEITWNSEPQVKCNKLLEKNSLAVSTDLWDAFLRSTSETVPYEFNRREASMQSFSCQQDDINQPEATFLGHEKKTNNNVTLLIRDPSTSNNQLRNFGGKQSQKMPNHSDLELSPSQIGPPGMITFEKLYHGSYALPRMQSSAHDVKTMTICTTIDSVEEFSRGPPKFSQTTHNFLITKRTDVNLSDGGQMFIESPISTNFKGKTVSQLLNPSPEFGSRVKQGVKLQPLDSSTESDGKENIENVKTPVVNSKNESSTETDTLDMDALCENHLSGVASSPSNKDINGSQKSPASQAVIPSFREETEGRLLNTELPDIKQELHVPPSGASSMDVREPSISRTQSLDVEHLLSTAEHPTNSKSSACPDDLLGSDPCRRWVKRLKPSTSYSFAYGTKSSRMGEASSHEKVSKIFSKILKCSKTSPEPKMSKSYGKEQMVIDQTAELLRNAEFSSSDSVRKSQDISLSHAWIQRWCHNPSASLKKKPEAIVVCEPKVSKATLDFQKKQFPSIAAMALMGKAMTSFRPCEFRKRGSFVVWNTNGY